MADIHFIGGEKGGVGKSMMSRILAQYFIDHDLPFIGFDTDKSHGALLRFYSDYASKVVVDNFESLDHIVDAATLDFDRAVLVDLAAQTQESLTRWIEDSDLLGLAEELGLGIRYWHVMDSGRDSVDLLRVLLDRFGDKLNYVLVLNQVRGDDFGILKQSGLLPRAQELGAKVVTLKRLHETSMVKIDASNSSFWAATQCGIEHELGLLERQRVKMWLKSAYHELDQVMGG